MIGTRILVGSLLAIATVGVLVVDGYLAPWFPCLFLCLMAAGVLASRELVTLFPEAMRPSLALTTTSILLCLAGNWYPTIRRELGFEQGSFWPFLICASVAAMVAAFLLEMYRYRQPGGVVARLGATVLSVAYLGLLPCFFAQIRFIAQPLHGFAARGNHYRAEVQRRGGLLHRHVPWPDQDDPAPEPEEDVGGIRGRHARRHAGGCDRFAWRPIFRNGWVEAIAFGLVMGVAGVLGDLAESLIKRDCQTKDASKQIPGFGGLLDVIDSVLFAAPVAFVWFTWSRS